MLKVKRRYKVQIMCLSCFFIYLWLVLPLAFLVIFHFSFSPKQSVYSSMLCMLSTNRFFSGILQVILFGFVKEIKINSKNFKPQFASPTLIFQLLIIFLCFCSFLAGFLVNFLVLFDVFLLPLLCEQFGL